jgi:hypothetical protein
MRKFFVYFGMPFRMVLAIVLSIPIIALCLFIPEVVHTLEYLWKWAITAESEASSSEDYNGFL